MMVRTVSETLGAGVMLTGRKRAWVLIKRLPTDSARSDIWLAHAAEDASEHVVIKLSIDPAGRRLVRREIHRLDSLRDSLLESSNIIKPLDDCPHPDAEVPWFAMAIAEYGSLAHTYATRQARPLRELLGFALAVVYGLLLTEVVHRDLNPTNLLIYRQGGGMQLRITGWGRSIVHGAPQTQTLLIPAASGFVAPQALLTAEDADVRDDLFSVGAILWWGCTGSAPEIRLDGGLSDGRPSYAISGVLPALNAMYPQVPASLATVVAQLLSINRGDRSPALEGRSNYLRWIRDQLHRSDEEVKSFERRSGSAVAVGPAALQLTAPPAIAALPRRSAVGETTQREGVASAHRPSERRVSTTDTGREASSEQESGRRLPTGRSDADAHVASRRAEPAQSVGRAPTPPPVAPTQDERMRWREQRKQVIPAAARRPASTLAPRQSSQLVWALIASAFAIEVVMAPLVFQPAGALSGPLVMFGALAFAAATAWLDALISARFGVLPIAIAQMPTISTRALLAARITAAVLVGVFAGQALMIRVLDADLAALSVSRARPTQVRSEASLSSLRQLEARRAQERSGYERELGLLRTETTRLRSEIKSGSAAGAQAAQRRVQTALETKRELLESHAANESKFAAERAAVVHELDATRADLGVGEGRVQLLYRFLQSHVATIVLFVFIVLLLIATECAPSTLAVLTRRRDLIRF
jgi:serine/threonine protein kinase